MRTEYSKWEAIFSNLKYAQNRQFTEVENISLLSDQFSNDPRSQIKSVFLTSASEDVSYRLIIERLLRATDMIAENSRFPVATFDTSNMTSSSSDSQTLYQNTLMNAEKSSLL